MLIKRVQVLWYLNKEDFENYCLDFKEYKSHKIEGYEIVDVDEDLIYDLCDRDPDRLEPLGYFKNVKEVQNHVKSTIENNEFELDLDSPELTAKVERAISSIEFSGEDYYIAIGELGCEGSVVASWYDSLRREYNSSSEDNMWVLMVTGYDPYELALTGKTLTYILADILNLNESYFDEIIPNKGRIDVDEWNGILDKVYKKNRLYLGLKRAV